MEKGPGGGQKINRLRQFLEEHTENRLMMVCDTFDLIPWAATSRSYQEKYEELADGKVLFAAEPFCWPDQKMMAEYQFRNGDVGRYAYLNSGSFIGYRDDIYRLIQDPIDDSADDQLYFARKYLSGTDIILDHQCQLFQTLNGSTDSVSITTEYTLHNDVTGTNPMILHGNGPSKLRLNHLENYHLSSRPSCIISSVARRPSVFIAAYADSQLPEYTQFMESIKEIQRAYPRSQVIVYNRSSVPPSSSTDLPVANEFVHAENSPKYVYDDFMATQDDFYFLLEQHVLLTDPRCLHRLVELLSAPGGHYSAVAPMVRCPGTLQTNFWGALDPNGYYKRSEDYVSIVDRTVTGLFNVPYLNGAILMGRETVSLLKSIEGSENPDMDLCASLRQNVRFMYVDNREICGSIVAERF